jgi:hypothetical protein
VCIDKYLDELRIRYQTPHHFAFGTLWRDERAQDDQASVYQQFCHLAGPGECSRPDRLRETQCSRTTVCKNRYRWVTPSRNNLRAAFSS